jgi:hypothetical protein
MMADGHYPTISSRFACRANNKEEEPVWDRFFPLACADGKGPASSGQNRPI